MHSRSSFYRNVFVALLGLIASLNPHALLGCGGGGPILQVGWFTETHGKSQHVGIEGLIGDAFSVKRNSSQNFLVGAGYYFNGPDIACLSQTKLQYGINAFYLAPTKVKGKVTQEDLFTNLSYHYYRTNYPIYFAARALIHCGMCYDLVLDLGIGPNIISAHGFKERSLDGGITVPDNGNIFSSRTKVAFSAMAGLGWRINNVWNDLALEINYRFFYLGQGELKKGSSQVKNHLRTGHNYASALFLSICI